MFLKPQYLKNPFKLLKSAKKDYKCMKFLVCLKVPRQHILDEHIRIIDDSLHCYPFIRRCSTLMIPSTFCVLGPSTKLHPSHLSRSLVTYW